jgi:SAM-dependent methyltransferase
MFRKVIKRFVNEIVLQPILSTSRPPYPVAVERQDIKVQARKEPHEVFDHTKASEINRDRIVHLESLHLQLEGKTVLDVGCGVGHLAQFFTQKGCKVVCADGRPDNIATLHQLYPNLEAQVVDLETQQLLHLGYFDIVFAYGILYHLENPIAGLRNIASVCQEMLLLETIICDHTLPIVLIEDESMSSNQALKGIGSRPSPSYIVMTLNRVGFPFIYAPKNPPTHPDFQFEWKNNLDTKRDGRNLRCVFIASKVELRNPNLTALI